MCFLALTVLAPPARADVPPVNPVTLGTVPAANGGFSVFVEGDTLLAADESEGSIATGGDLTFASTYNVAFQTDIGRTGGIGLLVGGEIVWPSTQNVLRVEQGQIRVFGDPATFDLRDTDQNGVPDLPWRVVPEGAAYESEPRVEGRIGQDPTTVDDPVAGLDLTAAFTRYRALSTELAACPVNTRLLDANGNPVTLPAPPGTNAVLQLTPGVTNVLTISGPDLGSLSTLGFSPVPTASTPLVVNVLGERLDGRAPQLTGVGGVQAPYILWNLPEATSARYTGAGAVEGTVYAPFADLSWDTTINLQGNVIARNFEHATGTFGTAPRELHDFAFDTTVSCRSAAGTLTLVKQTAGGGPAAPEDWTLTADGPTAVSGATGDPGVVAAPVAPGDYVLSESGDPDGYSPGAWTCDGGILSGDTLTVAAGEVIVCTVVNTWLGGATPTPTPSPTPPVPSPSPSTPGPVGPGTPGTPDDSSQLAALPATGDPSGSLLALALGTTAVGAAVLLLRRRAGS